MEMEDNAVSFVLDKLETILRSGESISLGGVGQLKSMEKKLRRIHEILQYSVGKSESDDFRKLLRVVSIIRHVVYNAEDVIDRAEAQAAKQRFRSKLRTFIFRLNHVTAISEIREKVTWIYKQIDQAYTDQERFSMKKKPGSYRDEDALRSFRKDAGKSELGFEEEEKMLERKLLEEGSEVVSLVGTGGLGKTSLARRIFHRKHVEEHFSCRAWVFVSQKYSIRDLLETMVRQWQVPIRADSNQEEELSKELSSWLQQQGNRYLIVFDDVWDLDFWGKIKKAFPGSGSGSRILITSRDKRAACTACPNPPLQLKPMNNDESWKLFMEKICSANMDKEMETTLESHKDKIVKKCDGLPLAIVSFAKALVSSAEIWHDLLLKYLDGDDSWLPPTELDSIAMSYNALPVHLRRCFLYFGLLPRNFDIPVRRLYRLWLAEGFAEHSISIKSPEDLVKEYLEALVDRSLIQISKSRSGDSPKTCRMPGILRDIFVSKAQEIGLFYIHGNSNSAGTASSLPVRRVVEHSDIKEFPHSQVDVQHVRSYISFNTMKKDMPAVGIGSFVSEVIQVQQFGILRVLDLEHVYKPKLPEELGKLYYLRYLGLRWTFLDSLPSSVGDLSYLETLDIKHTYITTLPNSIWKIKKLRHLLLNEIRLDMSLHAMSPPTQLQTLWGLFVDKKSPVKNGLDRMGNLRELGLTCHPDSIHEVSQWIANQSSLETLKLRCKDEPKQPPRLSLDPFSGLSNLTHLYLLGKLQKLPASNEFPPQLRVLTLSISELQEDPMPVLSHLPYLKVLKLYACSYTGETMDCPQGGFSSLHYLRLWMLRGLKTWIIHEEAMQKLSQVEIRCCSNLQELPDMLLKISALKRIIFTNMEELAENLEARKLEDKTITVTVKKRTFNFNN